MFCALNKIFAGASRVDKLQIAVRGEWENCLILERGDASASRRFTKWLSDVDGEFAVELFTSLSAPDDCFVGVRFPNPTSGAEHAIATLVEATAGSGTPFGEGLEMLAQAAGGELFENEPDFLELGLLNDWNPFGPLRFWVPGSGDPWGVLKHALAQNTRYLALLQKPAALEVAFSSPIPHWAGFIVSTRCEDGLYTFNEPLARARIQALGI